LKGTTVNTDRHSARKLLDRPVARWLAATAAAAAAVTALGACSSSSGASASGTSAATTVSASASSASPTAPSTAIPTQDVVSAVKVDPTLKAELPASIASSGTITLGTTFSPGTSGLPHGGQTADGTNIGLDVDLRDAVANLLGIKWDVQNGTFATIVPGVQNGKYQVGQDNFGVTKAREAIVDYATYLTDGQAFLGAKSIALNSVSTLTDVCGYTIATTPGSTFQQILTQAAGQCAAAGKKPWTVQYFTDSGPIFLGLANGNVDIYFGPTLSVKYDATHVANTKFLGQVSTTPVGFVTTQGSGLAKVLSDAVNELIADGEYAKIFAKWALTGVGTITQSQVNPPATL
jgi:polar amino acid transport system substrate-binding protein